MESPHLAIDYRREQAQARLAPSLQHGCVQLRRRMEATSSQMSGAKYMTAVVSIVRELVPFNSNCTLI
jgi:hypothetical protein